MFKNYILNTKYDVKETRNEMNKVPQDYVKEANKEDNEKERKILQSKMCSCLSKKDKKEMIKHGAGEPMSPRPEAINIGDETDENGTQAGRYAKVLQKLKSIMETELE